MLTTPTPLICEIFCATRVSAMSSTSVSGITLEVMPEDQHRRVGGIDLGVDRGRGQILRQQVLGSADGRLHLLLGHVDRERQS